MARDYKHRASRRKGRKPVAIWVWLLIGFLAGAGTTGFLCLRYVPGGDSGSWIGERPPGMDKPVAVKEPERRKRVPSPNFDFYNLLPDQEVVVPEEELARPPAPARPAPVERQERKPAVASDEGRKYLIQVSSVRSAREADALKARLGFLGMQAKVSRATIKGVAWYRVRLGPFHSTTEVRKVRKRLATSGYQTLVIALK